MSESAKSFYLAVQVDSFYLTSTSLFSLSLLLPLLLLPLLPSLSFPPSPSLLSTLLSLSLFSLSNSSPFPPLPLPSLSFLSTLLSHPPTLPPPSLSLLPPQNPLMDVFNRYWERGEVTMGSFRSHLDKFSLFGGRNILVRQLLYNSCITLYSCESVGD